MSKTVCLAKKRLDSALAELADLGLEYKGKLDCYKCNTTYTVGKKRRLKK